MVLKVTIAGMRGDVNNGLTPEVVLNMAQAYGTFMKQGTIIVGTDTRPTREMIKNLAIAGLLSTGCKVIDIGIAPTPTIAYMVKHLNASGGIIISASHNTVEYNALKLLKKDGIFLNKEEGNKIYELYVNKKFHLVPYNEIHFVEKENQAAEIFVDNIINSFRPYIDLELIKKKNFKIVIDAVNGAGAVVNKLFFKKLGIKDVVYLNHDINKVFPRNPEPTKANLKSVEEELSKYEFDIAFVQDPDADRLAFFTPKRFFISEELTLPIAIKGILEYVQTPVVINIATSLYNDFVVDKKVKVIRTPVGEANVVEKMISVKSIIGGEGNGGVIFGPFHYGRDSFAGMLLILNTLAKENRSIDDIIDEMPSYYMLKEKLKNFDLNKDFIRELKYNFYKGTYIFDDGVYYMEKTEEGIFWFLLRESNTEPIVRLQVEANDEKLAKSIIKKIKQLI